MTELLSNYVERVNATQQADAERFEQLNRDLCQLCHAHGSDKRSLLIDGVVLDCFYNIQEAIPEAISLAKVDHPRLRDHGYYLRICKGCRGDLLGLLRVWRDSRVSLRNQSLDQDGAPLEERGLKRNIPVRQDGRVILLNEDEYYAYRAELDRKAT